YRTRRLKAQPLERGAKAQAISMIGYRQQASTDHTTIWNHPSNANLKKLRQSPNVLFPGDVFHIPDKLQKQASPGRKFWQVASFSVSSCQRPSIHAH
ncbi:MAG: hypothetical protein ACXWC0_14960, partial [Burkholderiales bacterium]